MEEICNTKHFLIYETYGTPKIQTKQSFVFISEKCIQPIVKSIVFQL